MMRMRVRKPFRRAVSLPTEWEDPDSEEGHGAGVSRLKAVQEAEDDDMTNRKEQKNPLPAIAIAAGVAIVMLLVLRGRGARGPCVYDHVIMECVCRARGLRQIPDDVTPTAVTLQFGSELETVENRFQKLLRTNLSRFSQVRELRMLRCGIEELEPGVFRDLRELRRLDLRYNMITKLRADMFRGLGHLELLDLSNNPLNELDERVFQDLEIDRLVLANNPALSEIETEAFHGATVRSLTLNRCNLDTIKEGTFRHIAQSLVNLTITNNIRPLQLSGDVFKGITVQELNLDNNGLAHAQFLDDVVATTINLEDNPLGEVDFDDYPTMKKTRHLLLSRTQLTSITKENLSQLFNVETLFLNGNDINEMNASAFEHMHQLRHLDLSHNGLEAFTGDFRATMPRLDVLNLHSNDIQTLPETLEPLLTKLDQLTVHNNPLHCNCELRWFAKWLERHREILTDLQTVRCHTPDDTNLTYVSDYGFQCKRPTIFNTTFDEDGLSLVCIAGGDPAPTVTWVTPKGRRSSTRPSPSCRKLFKTKALLTISRDGNYTCIAENVAGMQTVEVNTRRMPSTGLRYHVESQEIEILETPRGLAVVLVLLSILGYIFRHS